MNELADHIARAYQHRDVLTGATFLAGVESACDLLSAALLGGHRILLAGNGGSAADAQHIASELVGRFRSTRAALPAMALTVDSSLLTAWSNDHEFATAFSRQVEAFGQPGDVLWSLSTSGNSPSILAAMHTAQARGMNNVLFSGRTGGQAASLATAAVLVPIDDTAHIQEIHVIAYHAICSQLDMLDRK